MNFFSVNQVSIPHLPIFLHLLTIFIGPLLIVVTVKHYQNNVFRRFFLILQFSQLVTLYGWYALKGFPLQECLPLYHCRIGMLSVFLFPNKSKWKQLFMILGVSGPLLALLSPDLYPYPMIHATNVAFYLGHYALMVNALIYLLEHYDSDLLTNQALLTLIAFVNAIMLVVNMTVHANYGFLTDLPIFHSHILFLNYLVVTFGLTALAKVTEFLYQKYLCPFDAFAYSGR